MLSRVKDTLSFKLQFQPLIFYFEGHDSLRASKLQTLLPANFCKLTLEIKI